MFSKPALLIAAATLANAHYILLSPPSIGFNDEDLTISPCGGFSPSDRSGGVTDWPVNGYPFSTVTTHLDVIWTFKVALLSNINNWIDIYPNVHQTGVPEFCIPQIPGVAAWIGQDAVVQIVQKAPDGDLHQCAAIRFVAGGPAPPGDCRNATGVEATHVPGTGPQPTQPPTTTRSTTASTTPRQTTTLRTTTTTTPPPNTEEPEPTEEPTEDPTDEPTGEPTGEPTAEPTDEPTYEPPTDVPTYPGPTSEPTSHHHHETTTSGGHHHPHPTDEPTLAPNTTKDVPTQPPQYTGGAAAGMTISFGAVMMAALAWAL